MPTRKTKETVDKPGRPATISDVARLAGVSVGTASKALNDRGSLREQTRDRVRAAAEELGFQPNKAAVALNYWVYNVPLRHGAHKLTPAQALGIAPNPLTLNDLLDYAGAAS